MIRIRLKLPRLFNHTATLTSIGIVLVLVGSILRQEMTETPAPPPKLTFATQNTVPEADALAGLLRPGIWTWGQLGFSVTTRMVTSSELAVAQRDLGQVTTSPASELEETTLEWLKLSGNEAVRRGDCWEYNRILAVGSLRVVASHNRIRLAQIVREENPGRFHLIQISPGQATISPQTENIILPSTCPIVATRHSLNGEVSAWLIGPVSKTDFLRQVSNHTTCGVDNAAFSAHQLPQGFVWFFSTSRGTFGLVIPQRVQGVSP